VERSQARGKLIGQATERLRKQSVKLAEMESRDAMHDDAATKHHRALPSQYIANPRDTAEQRAKWQGIGHLKEKKTANRPPKLALAASHRRWLWLYAGQRVGHVALKKRLTQGLTSCTHATGTLVPNLLFALIIEVMNCMIFLDWTIADLPSLRGYPLGAFVKSHLVKRTCEVCIPLDV